MNGKQHPADPATLAQLLALAQKTQGWNFREYPPQFARLAGGCELIVLPPWLWRRRCGIQRPRTACALITFPRNFREGSVRTHAA